MNETGTAEQVQTVKPARVVPDTSRIAGVSVRGWIALLVVLTICGMSWMGIDVKEPLYTLGGLVVGFYFGQKLAK